MFLLCVACAPRGWGCRFQGLVCPFTVPLLARVRCCCCEVVGGCCMSSARPFAQPQRLQSRGLSPWASGTCSAAPPWHDPLALLWWRLRAISPAVPGRHRAEFPSGLPVPAADLSATVSAVSSSRERGRGVSQPAGRPTSPPPRGPPLPPSPPLRPTSSPPTSCPPRLQRLQSRRPESLGFRDLFWPLRGGTFGPRFRRRRATRALCAARRWT